MTKIFPIGYESINFDIEEWFLFWTMSQPNHPNNGSIMSPEFMRTWTPLQISDETNSLPFFIVGWIAEKYPVL